MIVPTDVSEDVTTVEFNVDVVNVLAAAVTVIGDAPVKLTPLMFAPGDKLPALPVVF